MEHINIRVFYTKRGRLKYISHLDVNRLMQRVLKKADIPVWYTEGYNPHMYLTFALPLSLGCESEYEIMDFRITQEMPFDDIKRRLDDALPVGMHVIKVATRKLKNSGIAHAVYQVEKFSKSLSPTALTEQLNAYLAQGEILVEKKSKRQGFKTIDLKPDLNVQNIGKTDDSITFTLTLPAGERSVNPSLVTDSFNTFTGKSVSLTHIVRTMILDTENNNFE